MPYNLDPDVPSGTYASGLQQFDIAALQTMYGVNYNTRATDTEYVFDTNPGILTIWDGGDIDRIDASGRTDNVTIDLQPGHFSSIGGTKNIAVALVDHLAAGDQSKPLIEHARGGAGNDTLTGNIANNALEGRGGTNLLYGMGGNDLLISKGTNDVLDGGAGDDLLINMESDGHTQYVFAKGYGHDAINDNPYYADGITVFLRGLTPNDIDIIVKRYDANSENPDASAPYYVYGDTHISIKETGDTLLIPWTYRSDADGSSDYDYSGDFINFENGPSWTMNAFETHTTFMDYTDSAAFYAVDPTLYAAQQNWDLVPYFM